jgi:phosphate transport system protein
MSIHLQREIDSLKRRILAVGGMVEQAVAQAMSAVLERETAAARAVFEADDRIDKAEVAVEEECLKILALHQPVAIDLRFVVAVLKMNNDLERMGDLAVNLAERAVFLAENPIVDRPPQIQPMAVQAKSMIKSCLDALVNADVSLARRVLRDDDALDQMQRDAIAWVHHEVRRRPEEVESLINYFSVTRHLERLGDMATNVSEDVIYMVEGAIVRHGVHKEVGAA